jgi:hypothetical protein
MRFVLSRALAVWHRAAGTWPNALSIRCSAFPTNKLTLENGGQLFFYMCKIFQLIPFAKYQELEKPEKKTAFCACFFDWNNSKLPSN